MKQQDDDFQDIISADGLARASASTLELLTVLPQQRHSFEDGLLKLSFSHDWKNVPSPLSISLHVDATPGCGGLAWPAGQVHFFAFLCSFCVLSTLGNRFLPTIWFKKDLNIARINVFWNWAVVLVSLDWWLARFGTQMYG